MSIIMVITRMHRLITRAAITMVPVEAVAVVVAAAVGDMAVPLTTMVINRIMGIISNSISNITIMPPVTIIIIMGIIIRVDMDIMVINHSRITIEVVEQEQQEDTVIMHLPI